MSPDERTPPPSPRDRPEPADTGAPETRGGAAGEFDPTRDLHLTPPPRGVPVESVGPAARPPTAPSTAPAAASRSGPNLGASASAPSADAGLAEHAAPKAPPARLHGRRRIPLSAHVVMLTAITTLNFLAFVLIEPTPRWLLIFAAIVAVIGLDGTLRATWRVPFSGPAPIDSTPYLFLPALFVLATPILIEHNVRGYNVIAAALGGGLAFGAIVIAELLTVHQRASEYGPARWVIAAGAYFVAFALFAMPYVLELSLRTSIGAVALVSVMLALELLREGQVDPLETIVFSFVTGLVMGELRWSLHYLPIDGYLAGLGLVLGFFLVTGVIGSYLARRLDAILAVEYAIIAALGVALVIFARASGAA